MSEEKLQNPYEEEHDSGEVLIGRGACCAVIAAFILILLLPPLYRNVYEASLGGENAWIPVEELFQKPAGEKITEHLKDFEKELEDRAAFTEPPREAVQAALTGTLREGNGKTFIGRDGWLFLKPALDALTGYGPLNPEPDSVAKDPNRAAWEAPLAAIKTFAGQLEDLGVQLVLVPIPVKPMIYPEHITRRQYSAPLQHSDAADFYRQIEALPNARVIELADAFWSQKAGAQLFLKQDTHWTPEGMQLAASEIAERLSLSGEAPWTIAAPADIENIGDLVEQLKLPGDGRGEFEPERVQIGVVEGFTPDPGASITLLGDSFTNIYSSKSLNWGEGAGFAQHFACKIGRPLDVIAINGQASTGVRRELAKRGAQHLKKKEMVIWAIAARDLFLSETTARQNNVEWEDVAIPDIPDPVATQTVAAPLMIRATLVDKSATVDPATVTYKNAIFVCEYRVDEVLGGDYAGETILVKHWAFQDKQLSAASRRQPDTQVTLELVPFESKAELASEQGFDDFDEDVEKMLAPRYWAEGEAEAAVDTANPQRATLVASVSCLLATLLVVALAERLRRRKAPADASGRRTQT
jgi:lysophospholipase L1-like esterase